MGCTHICMDEVWGFFAALAVLKFVPGYMRAAWAARHQKPTCHHGEDHVHEVTEDMIMEEIHG